MLVLLVLSLIFTGLGLRRCAFRWDCNSGKVMLYMLALVGLPSLRARDACMVCGINGASRRNCKQKQYKTTFSPLFVFLLSRISGFLWSGLVLWHLWIGRARHPGPGSVPFHIEVLNVGGWLTHGDFSLGAEVGFLAVVEHRLIPARVRSEWARLWCKMLASVWTLASQDASRVGHAGVGVVSLRGAPLSLPSIATVQCQRFFFDCGRAVRCFLWVVVGLCTWLFCTGIRVLTMMLSGLL